MKWIVSLMIVLGAALAVGLLLARSRPTEQAQPNQPQGQRQPPQVRVIPAEKSRIASTFDLTGSVEPHRIAQLASPAEGPVVDLRVREGDPVTTGDTLLAIGRKEGINALLVSLREDLRKEQDSHGRIQQLVESGALPAEQLDQASVSYERAKAQLAKAQETAADYAVIAPWDGVVSRLIVREGQYVAPRASLVEIYDPSSLVIRAAVPERHAAELTTDMAVHIRLDAFPNQIVTGRIARMYPYLDPRLRTRTMEVTLNEPLSLLPGMFARLEVLLRAVEEAVVVPIEAVIATPKGQAVFVVEDGRAVRRPVETGIEEGNRIQIVAGLEPGERVIVAGNERLRDGAPVRISGEAQPGKGKKPTMMDRPGERKPGAGGNRP